MVKFFRAIEMPCNAPAAARAMVRVVVRVVLVRYQPIADGGNAMMEGLTQK